MEQERIIEIERILTESRFQFAIKCMHKVTQIMRKSNIAFSPHSIYEGLLLVYFISSGAIEERLKLILCLSNVPKYHLIQYYLLGRDFEQSEFQINASAASSDYGIERRCWIKATNFNHLLPLKSIFNNRLEVFNPFDTPIEKIARINMAIQSATDNYIPFPVVLEDVRNNMELVLMTVSRLNVQQFQILNCKSDPLNAPILRWKRKRRAFFCHELNMHVRELLYTNEKTSLFVFLHAINPADFNLRRFIGYDICDLMERLSIEEAICTLRNLLDSDTPSEDFSEFSNGTIFDLETDMPMCALLRDLGIEELLEHDAINLDSFFVDDDIVHLGNAVHRTHVKVTEDDIVAGAVNVIYTGQEDYLFPSSDSNQISQNCDFPFVWLIYDKHRRHVLFAGAFNKNCSLNRRFRPST